MRRLAVLAALAALVLTGCGPTARSSGLPLPADYRVMPVLLPGGQEGYLDAAVTPVVFVAPNDRGAVSEAARTYLSIGGPKRPLVFVETFLNTSSDAQALAMAKKEFSDLGVAWGVQLGPPDWYAASSPTLVWFDRAGRRHGAAGVAGVVRALKQAVSVEVVRR